MEQVEVDRIRDAKRMAAADQGYLQALEQYISASVGSNVEKSKSFAKYAPRQEITRFVSRYELFKRVLPVHGSIIECGVFLGQGVMTWAQLSSIFEPVNHQRRVYGFDTFAGFPTTHEKDGAKSSHMRVGALDVGGYEDLRRAIEIYDQNRFLGHLPKVELVKGDATRTIPAFVKANPHLVVSLLHLDFDLYEPTKAAIEHLVPRIPKGGIIVFDELNADVFPGETIAVHELLGISNLRIQRFPWDSFLSFAVVE